MPDIPFIFCCGRTRVPNPGPSVTVIWRMRTIQWREQRKETERFPHNLPLSRGNILPYVALMAAVLFWGGSFVATRVAVKALHPQAVMLCRMVIACLTMLPFAGRLIPENWDSGDLKLLIPMVMLQPCLYFFLESNALKLTTSSQAGVISAFVPLLVGLGAWMFLAEQITFKTVSGLVISLAGVSLLTLWGTESVPGENPLLGNSLEVLAMVCAAGNMIIVKQLSSRYNSWTLTGLQFLGGLLFFSPGIRHLMAVPGETFQPDLLIALGFLGLFASVGAFGLYNWAMSRVQASRASVFINLVPVVAVVLGWSILGESLTPGQMVGAFIVGVGVFISQRTEKPCLGPTH